MCNMVHPVPIMKSLDDYNILNRKFRISDKNFDNFLRFFDASYFIVQIDIFLRKLTQ